jgi:hypothetical protein
MLDKRARLRTVVQNLGLAFVNAAAPVHVTFLSLLAPSKLTTPPARGNEIEPRLSPIALLRNQPRI